MAQAYSFRSLTITQLRNPKHHFALKRLVTHDTREIQEEVTSLKRFRKVDGIIPLLFTYEVRDATPHSLTSNYCLVFPWASGDLKSLWKENERHIGDSRICPWIAQQCYALAQAVEIIHNGCGERTSADLPQNYGRHGDIKPSNILWFPSAMSGSEHELGRLVLGDFGLSAFNSELSRSNVPASSLAMSPKYRPPEFDVPDGTISRKVDIWALGCTFLEFLTWYLKGLVSVLHDFPQLRSETDIYGIYADTFFRVIAENGESVVMVKPQVISWISNLQKQENCSEYIRDFLKLIESHMIMPTPDDRITSRGLSERLRSLYERCKEDHTYYMK
jgi:serine/threonine protein kinase